MYHVNLVTLLIVSLFTSISLLMNYVVWIVFIVVIFNKHTLLTIHSRVRLGRRNPRPIMSQVTASHQDPAEYERLVLRRLSIAVLCVVRKTHTSTVTMTFNQSPVEIIRCVDVRQLTINNNKSNKIESKKIYSPNIFTST